MKMTATGLLLKNELRLWWRRVAGIKQIRALMIFIGLVVFGILLWLWFGLSGLRAGTAQVGLPDTAIWVAVVLWLFGFLFAFTQAINESVVVLFDRGDLDLLLSSPVSNRAVFCRPTIEGGPHSFFWVLFAGGAS